MPTMLSPPLFEAKDRDGRLEVKNASVDAADNDNKIMREVFISPSLPPEAASKTQNAVPVIKWPVVLSRRR